MVASLAPSPRTRAPNLASIGLFLAALGILLSARLTRAADIPSQPYDWRNVEIVGGGFVTGIVFHPAERDLIYARTDIGGAYRWDASTRRWVPLTDFVSTKEGNLRGTESIGIDPSDPNRVYLAEGTYTNKWGKNGAIFRSTDQGRTFQRTDLPFKLGGNMPGRSAGERLAVDPRDGKTIYFGSRDDGLWKSTDYGTTWQQQNQFPITGSTDGVGVIFEVFDHSAIYVGVSTTKTHLYRSTDAGGTWEPVPGQPKALIPHHAVLDTDGSLYLTYGDNPGPNGMTTGAVWKFNAKSGDWTDITPEKATGEQKFGYAGLAFDAQHSGTIMVATMDRWHGGDDIYRSADGGAHWTSLKAHSSRDSSGAPFLDWDRGAADLGHWIGSVAIDPFDPGHVLYVTGATIWGSDDVTQLDRDQQSHWTVRAQGLEETAVIELISPPTGAHLISALGDIAGFRHDDLTKVAPGGMWKNPLMNTTEGIDFAEQQPSLVVRVGHGKPGGRGAISADGAASWSPLPSEPKGSDGAGSVALSTDGATILWSPRRAGPNVSSDRGATWTRCDGIQAGNLQVLSDRVNPRTFYAFDRDNGVVYRSTDGGARFAQSLVVGIERNGLRAVPGREGDVWLAGAEHGLLHSTDSAATFATVDNIPVAHAIGFGRAAAGQSYPAIYLLGTVGTTAGIFRSDDGGSSWIRINDDAHQFAWAGPIIGDPRIYGRCFLGTNGRGILYADPASSVVPRH
jgi:photosystem II stability/assembly factor-like uncharacterized protein